ncbi:MAG: hypothetical protein OXN97_08655 [Bryobacterales bacterium]|nr:hypothetical protein [Bryobacterales bacterium]
MASKSQGKGYRKGIPLVGFMRLFYDAATAEAQFIEPRSPEGINDTLQGFVKDHAAKGAKAYNETDQLVGA